MAFPKPAHPNPYFHPGRSRAGFEDYEFVDRDQPKGGRLSDHFRPYLPDNTRFHRGLDNLGVGSHYRNYKSYLPYLGLKGELGELGLDFAEGFLGSYLLNE